MTIDFSSKHDVLIRNRDGTLLPMDEPFFQTEQVAEKTWKILSDGDFSYLLEGNNEALVIDSGYGCGNLREFAQTLTDKPVRRIANTHHHFDHTANNCYFEEAIMSAETVPLATIPYDSFSGIDFPRDYPKRIVREGDLIDLGDRVLEVFEIPCHAVGSLAFLDAKYKLLFCGDEVGAFCSLAGPLTDFIQNMKKLQARRAEFDILLCGMGPCSADCIENALHLAEDILAGVDCTPKGGHHGGPPKHDSPEGVTVYNRQGPRPGDGGAGKDVRVMAEGHNMRILYDPVQQSGIC